MHLHCRFDCRKSW